MFWFKRTKLAICLKCGQGKKTAATRCRTCGYSPRGDTIAEIRSLILSTEFLFPPNSDLDAPRDTAEYESIVAKKILELRSQAEIIKAGKEPVIDDKLVIKLARQNSVALAGIRKNWLSTAMFFLLLTIPILFAICAVIIVVFFV